MATSERGVIGLHAFSKDGAKLGKVKDVITAEGKQYLVIGRFLAKDLIVPAAGETHTDVRVEVNYRDVVFESAPEHQKGEPSAEELARIDQYYHTAA